MSDAENKASLQDTGVALLGDLVNEADMLACEKHKRLHVHNSFIVLGHFFITLIIFVLLVISVPIYIGKIMFEGKRSVEKEQIISIRSGAGIWEIASLLEKNGLIRSSDVFVYGVSYYQKSTYLKAGEYLVPANASMKDIMDILVRGRSVEYFFTVPEGLTVQQIFDRLATNEILTGNLPEELPPEGSLMTDTVRFTRGTTRMEIIRRLREGQAKLVKEIWDARSPNLPIKSMDEFVVLASIIEKETAIPEERSKVAAVFYNRLIKGMRLQSDPTVIYGIFGGRGKPPGRAIYRSDLEKETPYNTYKINGLPPTAIANPGRGSLKAAANAPEIDALYFVADGSGGHVFSKTLEEHNANVRKWRALKQDH
ncbi:endolytic transglycosylase MltG [Bartonella ancashensis]|uniref:endolytic transglycosylase MltG n=1 Tax=Bartonella ancashensis TaxID=1318743 RepID=UPI0006B43FFB|nr:endolytic transglycosylase MltG [Bartonella ancashensis]